ncbi:MAG: 3-ketoacyl-ACP reductase [Phycisphaerae bacterium]|mgnify:CR=1 FL=1|nr:3-ketoacyl-ACP reductase [Phycisphaerae bacterium]
MTDKPVALVTGGSRGIGCGIAEMLGSIGYRVAVNYRRSADEARQLVDRIVAAGGEAAAFQADIGLDADRQRLVEELRSRFGRIDLLVNNAGQAPSVRADILEASQESFDRLIETNLKGPYFLTQAVANWMLELKGRIGSYRPKIVFVTSISAEAASINRGDYCISKAGLSMAARLFAVRLAAEDIGVFEIRPGIIETDMTAGVKDKYNALIADGLVPQQRWGTPRDIAQAIRAIAQDLLPFSTGAVINVDGGLTLPRL